MKPIHSEITIRDLETGAVTRIPNAYVTVDTAVRIVGMSAGQTFRVEGPDDPRVKGKVLDRVHITVDGTATYPFHFTPGCDCRDKVNQVCDVCQGAAQERLTSPEAVQKLIERREAAVRAWSEGFASDWDKDVVTTLKAFLAQNAKPGPVDGPAPQSAQNTPEQELEAKMLAELGHTLEKLAAALSPSEAVSVDELRTQLNDLKPGRERSALIVVLGAVKYLLNWRVSKRLTFVTDAWGRHDVTHFELKWNGRTLQVDVDGTKIQLVGPLFKVTESGANYATLVQEH
jgi:hypothetical protein